MKHVFHVFKKVDIASFKFYRTFFYIYNKKNCNN